MGKLILIVKKPSIQDYCSNAIKYMVFKPAGMLPYNYITPSPTKNTDKPGDRMAGKYTQQYDWDTYFIGLALSQAAPEKVIFFKEALLNFLVLTTPNGKTPRTISPITTWDSFDQHKPFLAQGCLLAAKTLNDYSWIESWVWEKLVAFVNYWENTQGFHGLARWRSALESGPDNNPTIVGLSDYAAESVDVNTYLYFEFLAMAELAKATNHDHSQWDKKASYLKTRMQLFWDEQNQTYHDIYNFTDKEIEFIPVTSWTNFSALWAKIPTQKQADIMIKKYILAKNELMGPFGLRSISIADPIYNTGKRHLLYEHSSDQRRVISNWQGPMWVIAAWIISQGLYNYGYRAEAKQLAKKTLATLQKDLDENGTLHENYNPETGEGLWSPGFGSWNLLAWKWLESFDSNK